MFLLYGLAGSYRMILSGSDQIWFAQRLAKNFLQPLATNQTVGLYLKESSSNPLLPGGHD